MTAVSTANGVMLWEHKFGHVVSARNPLLVVCGSCLFAAGSGEALFMNCSDGSVIWKEKFEGSSRLFPGVAAWDGADRILVGMDGYVYRFNLRDKKEEKRINLKGLHCSAVCITYDNMRKMFYAGVGSKLYAISAYGDNKIEWVANIPWGLMRMAFCSVTVEQLTGRVYVIRENKICCVAPDGKTVFSKVFKESAINNYYHSVSMDVEANGMILVGCGCSFRLFDLEGNLMKTFLFKGVRNSLVSLCTSTSSADPSLSMKNNQQLRICRS